MFNRSLVMQVQELLERFKDVKIIANNLKMDPAVVQAVIDTINNTLT